MWTYSGISLMVTAVVLFTGLLGFVAGWITHRMIYRERLRVLDREIEELEAARRA